MNAYALGYQSGLSKEAGLGKAILGGGKALWKWLKPKPKVVKPLAGAASKVRGARIASGALPGTRGERVWKFLQKPVTPRGVAGADKKGLGKVAPVAVVVRIINLNAQNLISY